MNWIFFLLLICILGWVVYKLTKRKELIPPQVYRESVKQIQQASLLHPEHAVLKMHKVFVSALQSMRSHKTEEKASTTIMRYEKKIPNAKIIWKYHRLRNKIAHDMNVSVTEKDIPNMKKAFLRALKRFHVFIFLIHLLY